jgi:topoisomerase-4 subunit A
MPKGKGIKIINIPSAKLKSGEESVTAISVINEEQSLFIQSGKRHKVMKPADMENFEGERGQRGRKLPQGFRTVERLRPEGDITEEA